MFENLTDFAIKRTPKQAFGFYLFYLLTGLLFAAIAGGMVGILSGDASEASKLGQKSGVVFGTVYSLLLSFLVVHNRKLPAYFYLLSILLSVVGFFGGAFLGVIPATLMTTRGKAEGNRSMGSE